MEFELRLRSLLTPELFFLPVGMTLGSVMPVDWRVFWALYCSSLSPESLKACSVDFILQSRVFCLRSHMSWHDWQTLLAESLMDGSSTLQLMHAPGFSV